MRTRIKYNKEKFGISTDVFINREGLRVKAEIRKDGVYFFISTIHDRGIFRINTIRKYETADKAKRIVRSVLTEVYKVQLINECRQ